MKGKNFLKIVRPSGEHLIIRLSDDSAGGMMTVEVDDWLWKKMQNSGEREREEIADGGIKKGTVIGMKETLWRREKEEKCTAIRKVSNVSPSRGIFSKAIVEGLTRAAIRRAPPPL